MTIEEKLKEYIISNYKSLRNFVNTSGVGVPYSTIDGILKRGIGCASIDNVFKICDALDISADALINGNIVPRESKEKKNMEVETAFFIASSKVNMTIDNKPVNRVEMLMLLNNIHVSVEMIKQHRAGNIEGSQSMLWRALKYIEAVEDKDEDEFEY